VAGGVYRDVTEASTVVGVDPNAVQPDMEAHSLYEEILQRYRSLYPATRETMRALHDLSSP
jgi:sugar (pentulose or hexulose) kinase